MTDIIDSMIDACDDFLKVEQAIVSGLNFRGRTLLEWEDFLKLPPISDKISQPELVLFNLKYIEINECIMSNLAYAKSLYDVSYAQYKNTYRLTQNEIIESYNQQNKKISIEFINQYASSKCSKLFYVVKINEIFYNFWTVYKDKLNLLDSRLSNLSFLMRN